MTDGLIALVNFTLIKWVADASSSLEQGVYVAGALGGSYLGMRLTRHWEA